jgi:hypothetical protein
MKKNKIICTSLEEKYTKGITPIINDLKNTNGNILIIDNNLNVYNSLKKNIKKNYKLITFGLTSEDRDDNKDLLDLVNNLYKEGKTSLVFELLNDFSNVIFKGDSIDPFWNESAASLFIGASLYMFKTCDFVSFKDVYDKVNYFSEEGKEELVKYLEETNDRDIAMYLDGLVKMPEETKGGVVATFNQKLRNIAYRMQTININFDLNKDNPAYIIRDYNDNFSREARLIYVFLKRMSNINDKQLNVILPNIDNLDNIEEIKNDFNNGPTMNITYYLITN